MENLTNNMVSSYIRSERSHILVRRFCTSLIMEQHSYVIVRLICVDYCRKTKIWSREWPRIFLNNLMNTPIFDSNCVTVFMKYGFFYHLLFNACLMRSNNTDKTRIHRHISTR